MSYTLIHSINKERKRTKKKEKLLLLLLIKTGHFNFGLTLTKI
jgi:hypothetical protein